MDVFFGTGINYLDQYNLGLHRKSSAVGTILTEFIALLFYKDDRICHDFVVTKALQIILTDCFLREVSL
jgi:hypothetical protein